MNCIVDKLSVCVNFWTVWRSIIDKYAQEAFKFLKEARPDLSLPDKESLLRIIPGLRMVHGGSNLEAESTGALELEVPSAGDTAPQVIAGESTLMYRLLKKSHEKEEDASLFKSRNDYRRCSMIDGKQVPAYIVDKLSVIVIVDSIGGEATGTIE